MASINRRKEVATKYSALRLLVAAILGVGALGCSREARPQSPLLDGGLIWRSDDRSYTLHFPKGWVVSPQPFGIAYDLSSTTRVATCRGPSVARTSTDQNLAELRRLAMTPGTLDSSGWAQLEVGDGRIAGFPAAWNAIAFDDRQMGQRVGMQFVVSTPEATYTVFFMLVPRAQFDKMRPTFGAIVDSLEAS